MARRCYKKVGLFKKHEDRVMIRAGRDRERVQKGRAECMGECRVVSSW